VELSILSKKNFLSQGQQTVHERGSSPGAFEKKMKEKYLKNIEGLTAINSK